MADKVTILCLIAFLVLSSTLTHTAARPPPAFADVTPMETQSQDVEAESCEGAEEEECLMRRTLAANLDYIYTQKQNP